MSNPETADPSLQKMQRTTDTSKAASDWKGVPPNGQGMYHWLVSKEHGRHVVAWFDLHEWTTLDAVYTRKAASEAFDYLAPCNPPEVKQ